MRSRQEIKAIGKDRFRANYWPSVLAVLLAGLALLIIDGLFSGGANQALISMAVSGDVAGVTETAVNSIGFLSCVGTVIGVIATAVLEIGRNRFFILNTMGRTSEINAVTPFTSCAQNFGRKLGGFLWMELFICLWALLTAPGGFFLGMGAALESSVLTLLGVILMIAGTVILVIKALSYAMTPYILADCPNVKARDALKLSMCIMKGHKGDYFVFGLSFIGWMLLSCLTLGLLGVFYVGPYVQSSMACYYLEVREDALRSGTVTVGALSGGEAV